MRRTEVAKQSVDQNEFCWEHGNQTYVTNSPKFINYFSSYNLSLTSEDTSTEEKGEGSMPPSISPSQITHDFPQSQDLVDFDGPDDPYNPLNWPFAKKVVVTMLYSVCTMGTTWASTMLVSCSLAGPATAAYP